MIDKRLFSDEGEVSLDERIRRILLFGRKNAAYTFLEQYQKGVEAAFSSEERSPPYDNSLEMSSWLDGFDSARTKIRNLKELCLAFRPQ